MQQLLTPWVPNHTFSLALPLSIFYLISSGVSSHCWPPSLSLEKDAVGKFEEWAVEDHRSIEGFEQINLSGHTLAACPSSEMEVAAERLLETCQESFRCSS